MKVFDIVTETKVNEYVKRGSGAGQRISPERMQELNLNVQGSWHLYGSDTSTWEYSSNALRDLFAEGMAQHIEHTFGLDPESDDGKELATRIMNWLTNEPSGQAAKQNIIKAFRFVSEQDGENGTDPIKHNEALGLMMNLLLMINDALEQIVNQED